jgi:tetratricopeptide (TPR) repeat protein
MSRLGGTHLAGVILAMSLAIPARARAQGKFPPDSFVNLKVFPKNVDRERLLGAMRGFTAALGVRCPYCHVGQEGMPLDSFNFSSDDKRTKRTARLMMQMVRRINDSTLAQIPERASPTVEATCWTCHRGVARPQPLGDLLRVALDAGGLDSAVRAYRDLRQRYYGRSSYDFGEGTLNGLGIQLARDRRLKEALGMLDVNAEFFPGAPSVPFSKGEAYLVMGDTASALTAYAQALAADSTFRPARERLRRLRGR